MLRRRAWRWAEERERVRYFMWPPAMAEGGCQGPLRKRVISIAGSYRTGWRVELELVLVERWIEMVDFRDVPIGEILGTNSSTSDDIPTSP